jgi:hypothetical protein
MTDLVNLDLEPQMWGVAVITAACQIKRDSASADSLEVILDVIQSIGGTPLGGSSITEDTLKIAPGSELPDGQTWTKIHRIVQTDTTATAFTLRGRSPAATAGDQVDARYIHVRFLSGTRDIPME